MYESTETMISGDHVSGSLAFTAFRRLTIGPWKHDHVSEHGCRHLLSGRTPAEVMPVSFTFSN